MKIDLGSKPKVLTLQKVEITIRDTLNSKRLGSQQEKIHSKIRRQIDRKIDNILWVNIMETILKRRVLL